MCRPLSKKTVYYTAVPTPGRRGRGALFPDAPALPSKGMHYTRQHAQRSEKTSMYSCQGHAEAPTFGDGWLCIRCCEILALGGGVPGRMHSKLQGLAKPSRVPMPRTAGECPGAVSGKPQAGCIAWRRGGKLTGSKTQEGIPKDPKANARLRVAAGSRTHQSREAASRRARKKRGKNTP